MLKPRHVYHHIRYTRPQWYHDYHKWKHHKTLHWVTFFLSSFVMIVGFINVVIYTRNHALEIVYGATTTVTANVTAGSLTIANAQSSVALSSETINVASMPSSSGSIGDISVTDNRGSGVGWTATVTCNNFGAVNTAVRTGGANGSLTSGGSYNFATGGTYTIIVDVGGATFDVSGLETQSNVALATGTPIVIGTRGVTVQFSAATYNNTDAWTIRADTIPVTGVTITPGVLSTLYGSPTNVSAGSPHTFLSTADSTTLIQASTAGGYGMGQYKVTPNLSIVIPVSTYANNYSAVLTTTVN